MVTCKGPGYNLFWALLIGNRFCPNVHLDDAPFKSETSLVAVAQQLLLSWYSVAKDRNTSKGTMSSEPGRDTDQTAAEMSDEIPAVPVLVTLKKAIVIGVKRCGRPCPCLTIFLDSIIQHHQACTVPVQKLSRSTL